MKALRDLGVLLLLLLGMLWLAAVPDQEQQYVPNGVVESAQLELPPVPEALLERLPSLQLPLRAQAFGIEAWSGATAVIPAGLLQKCSAPGSWQQVRLHGQLQLLQQCRLYPFHEFG